jgi:hypothetical protein
MPEFIAHTDPESTSTRTGPGRWAVVMTPCPGILWTNDEDAVGFVALGQVDDTIFDSTDIDEQIQANIDAGLTATKAFGLLANLVGKNTETGNLTNWKPQRMRPRPNLGPEPVITSSADIKRRSLEDN